MNSELSTFPGHVIAHHHLFISQSVNKEMLSNYSAGLIHFTRFCNNFSILEASHMPASEALLAMFITHWGAGSVGPGALKSWLLSIELWHNINRAPWHGATLIHHAISGVAKNVPIPSSVLKCEPVILQHLQTLRRCLDLSNVFDAAVFAVACIVFWCCCRLGELVVDIKFEPTCHVAHSVVIACGTASNNIHSANFHLPSTKMKGVKGDDVNVSDSTCPCSMVTTLDHHLLANAQVLPEAPLFAFEMADGSWGPLK